MSSEETRAKLAELRARIDKLRAQLDPPTEPKEEEPISEPPLQGADALRALLKGRK
jgi:hypothetical protein